jgi:hypothetical protein
MVIVNLGVSHAETFFRKLLQFGHASSKKFRQRWSRPKVLKNIAFKGQQIITLPGAPIHLGPVPLDRSSFLVISVPWGLWIRPLSSTVHLHLFTSDKLYRLFTALISIKNLSSFTEFWITSKEIAVNKCCVYDFFYYYSITFHSSSLYIPEC